MEFVKGSELVVGCHNQPKGRSRLLQPVFIHTWPSLFCFSCVCSELGLKTKLDVVSIAIGHIWNINQPYFLFSFYVHTRRDKC